MSEPTPYFYCSNHPGLATHTACMDCGRPFCESCLTEMTGRPLCGWCRDQRLSRIQRRSTVNPATIVVLARVFNGLTLLLGIGLAAFSGLYAGLLFSLPGSDGSDLGMGLGGIVAVVGGTVALSLLLYLPPLIGLGRGRAWLWVWQLVTIGFSVIGGCIGVLSIGPILIIPAVILLIFWIKPEVRDYCSLPG